MPIQLLPPRRLAPIATLLIAALGQVLVPLQVLAPARAQAPLPSPASNEISLVFEHEPKSSGISFVPEGLKWGEIEVEGKQEAAWIAQRGSFPEDKQGFARAVKFVITDPRFKNGLQRAVDVEVEYLFRPDSNIRFMADTVEGEKMVHQAFGGVSKWQTAKFSIDNARFNTNAAANPDKKFDLRITGWGEADLGIRSIKIKGFDFPGQGGGLRALTVAWCDQRIVKSAASTCGLWHRPELPSELSNLSHKSIVQRLCGLFVGVSPPLVFVDQ